MAGKHERSTNACTRGGNGAVLADYIEEVAADRYVDTEAEQEFFRIARRHGVLATDANRLLEDTVRDLGAIRERTLSEELAVIVDVAIRDRVLDRSEESNLFAWASLKGLRRDTAERIICERCDWAGAGRQSAKSKPFSELRVKLLGLAIAMLLVVGIVGAAYLNSTQESAASRSVEASYSKAIRSLQEDRLLVPVEDSAYHWLWMIQKADPESPRARDLRSIIRREYISRARRSAPDSPSSAAHYLELAAALRPGADVEEMVRLMRLLPNDRSQSGNPANTNKPRL